MDANTEKKLTDALERAEHASAAAQRAIDARDIEAAPALISETLLHTLEVLSLATSAGQLRILQNLAPSVVFYVKLLTKLDGSVFDGIESIKAGSVIGSEPVYTSRLLELFKNQFSKRGE
jgi:hypothetical protein